MKKLIDRKSKLTYAIFSNLNRVILKRQFSTVDISGRDNLPDGGFILVSNHTARWDGLLVYDLLARPANFLVSPNELKGLQGMILSSMGAFPASAGFDLQAHVARQLAKGEPVVIFPEGDIYSDGKTHAFKSGAARMALACARAELIVPVIPAAICHVDGGRAARIAIGSAVDVRSYLQAPHTSAIQVRLLTERLFREVCHLRYQLGSREDQVELFTGRPTRSWVHPSPA